MAKKKYKKKERDAVDNAVYVFHNQVFNFDMFINALNADDAMAIDLTNVVWLTETIGKLW